MATFPLKLLQPPKKENLKLLKRLAMAAQQKNYKLI